MKCPCDSQLDYTACCEPYILGKAFAPTPEALMRSRYSAYVKMVPPYLKESLAPEVRHEFKESDVKEWSRTSEWLGLQIISAKDDIVEFTAKYKTQGKIYEHHETSKFRKEGNRWYFVDGESHIHEEGKGHEPIVAPKEPQKPMVREAPKVGRNDPCHCGSGKKFKKCHGTN